MSGFLVRLLIKRFFSKQNEKDFFCKASKTSDKQQNFEIFWLNRYYTQNYVITVGYHFLIITSEITKMTLNESAYAWLMLAGT